MPLVSQYAHLRKPNVIGAPCEMWPLRAVGLACERGHRLSAKEGLGRLTPEALTNLPLTGDLTILEGGRWRSARSCTLKLRPADATLAWTIVHQQRVYLSDIALNCWAVDIRLRPGMPPYDLVGDFSIDNSWGIAGRVWVELKAMAARGFDTKFVEAQKKLEKTFEEARERDSSLDAVLLLCARCEGSGREWGKPEMVGRLFSSAGWVDPSPSRRHGPRGRCQSRKPPANKVFADMEWIPDPSGSGPRLGLVNHFFALLELPKDNVGKRAAAFNKRLRDEGVSGKLVRLMLRDRGGRAAWVAPKSVFRKIYAYV